MIFIKKVANSFYKALYNFIVSDEEDQEMAEDLKVEIQNPSTETKQPKSADSSFFEWLFEGSYDSCMPLAMLSIQHMIYIELLNTMVPETIYHVHVEWVNKTSQYLFGLPFGLDVYADLIAACYTGPLDIFVVDPKDESNWITAADMTELSSELLFNQFQSTQLNVMMCASTFDESMAPGVNKSVTAQGLANVYEMLVNEISKERDITKKDPLRAMVLSDMLDKIKKYLVSLASDVDMAYSVKELN